jgi:hypothetical protein
MKEKEIRVFRYKSFIKPPFFTGVPGKFYSQLVTAQAYCYYVVLAESNAKC